MVEISIRESDFMNDSTNPSDPIVLVEKVSKDYRRDEIVVPVLVDMDLRLDAGDFTALMGPSGSGKSTLLNLLSGMLRTTVGEVLVMGQRLDQMGDRQRDRFRIRSHRR